MSFKQCDSIYSCLRFAASSFQTVPTSSPGGATQVALWLPSCFTCLLFVSELFKGAALRGEHASCFSGGAERQAHSDRLCPGSQLQGRLRARSSLPLRGTPHCLGKAAGTGHQVRGEGESPGHARESGGSVQGPARQGQGSKDAVPLCREACGTGWVCACVQHCVDSLGVWLSQVTRTGTGTGTMTKTGTGTGSRTAGAEAESWRPETAGHPPGAPEAVSGGSYCPVLRVCGSVWPHSFTMLFSSQGFRRGALPFLRWRKQLWPWKESTNIGPP